ncbi:MAG TPA: addiction module protein [Casimicrobiaceae bacterium]|jgi:putative addiction module component (TIGR02574 family)
MATLTHDDIVRLSTAERLRLIADLWDSIESADMPVSAAERDELLRRLESFDRDRPAGIAWEDLKTELADRAP